MSSVVAWLRIPFYFTSIRTQALIIGVQGPAAGPHSSDKDKDLLAPLQIRNDGQISYPKPLTS